MPKQELDLLEIPAALAAELRTRPSEIVRPETLDPDLLGSLLDDRPDGLVAQGVAAGLLLLPIRTSSRPLSIAAASHQASIPFLN